LAATLRPPTPALATPAAAFARAWATGACVATSAARRRSALEDRLAAGREHRLECFDSVVCGLEEQIVDSGLGPLELPDQRLGMAPRGHGAAQLRRHAVAARPPQHHELALLGRLDEVLRPAATAWASPTACRWSCLRLEVLRCFHEIDEVDVGGPQPRRTG
jgi:hypothetical protein